MAELSKRALTQIQEALRSIGGARAGAIRAGLVSQGFVAPVLAQEADIPFDPSGGLLFSSAKQAKEARKQLYDIGMAFRSASLSGPARRIFDTCLRGDSDQTVDFDFVVGSFFRALEDVERELEAFWGVKSGKRGKHKEARKPLLAELVAEIFVLGTGVWPTTTIDPTSPDGRLGKSAYLSALKEIFDALNISGGEENSGAHAVKLLKANNGARFSELIQQRNLTHRKSLLTGKSQPIRPSLFKLGDTFGDT